MIPDFKFEHLVFITLIIIPSIAFANGLCAINEKVEPRKLNKAESLFLLPYSFVYLSFSTSFLLGIAKFFNLNLILGFYFKIFQYLIDKKIIAGFSSVEALLFDRCTVINWNLFLLVGISIFSFQFLYLPYFIGYTCTENIETSPKRIDDFKYRLNAFNKYMWHLASKYKKSGPAKLFRFLGVSYLILKFLFSLLFIYKLPIYFLCFLMNLFKFDQRLVNFFTSLSAPEYFRSLDSINYLYVLDVTISDQKMISGTMKDFSFNSSKELEAIILEDAIRWDRNLVQTQTTPHPANIFENQSTVLNSYKVQQKKIPGEFIVINHNTAKEINFTKYFRTVFIVYKDAIDTKDKIENRKKITDTIISCFDLIQNDSKNIFSNFTIFYSSENENDIIEIQKSIEKKYSFKSRLIFLKYDSFDTVKFYLDSTYPKHIANSTCIFVFDLKNCLLDRDLSRAKENKSIDFYEALTKIESRFS